MILSEEVETYRCSIHAQAVERIAPHVRDLDTGQRFSGAVWNELRRMDLFALPFPEAVGGLGGSFLAFLAATLEIARVCAAPAFYALALERLQQHRAAVEIRRVDVSNESQVVDAMGELIESSGQLDTCIASAGVTIGPRDKPRFVETTLEEWKTFMLVNPDGTFLTLRAAAKHMIAQGRGGSLVGLSSIAAQLGAPRDQAYAASKAHRNDARFGCRARALQHPLQHPRPRVDTITGTAGVGGRRDNVLGDLEAATPQAVGRARRLGGHRRVPRQPKVRAFSRERRSALEAASSSPEPGCCPPDPPQPQRRSPDARDQRRRPTRAPRGGSDHPNPQPATQP